MSLSGLRSKLAYRAYLSILRWESTTALRLRVRIVDAILGRRHAALFVFPNVYLEGIAGLTLGDHVSINRGSNLSAGGGLTIGNHVAIGHDTSILTSNHGYSERDVPIKYQKLTLAPVTIGDNVWIGAKVIVLPGVSIASGTVVAAGAIVSKSVLEPDTIIAGIPARRLKGRLA